jgi:two-component system, OmpR family, response regulator
MTRETMMNALPSPPSLRSVPPHVLVIDDDVANRKLMAQYLRENDLRVTALPDGQAIPSLLEDEVFDVVLLDLKLQVQDGMTLARRLRSLSMVPLIILTDRGEEADRVMGLEMGADEYLMRPSPRELLARIRALLRRHAAEMRRGRPKGVRAYRVDGWELNLNTRRLTASEGRPVPLSNGEFHLLVAFLGSSQRVLSRGQLLDLSHLHNDEVFDRAIDVQVSRLRRKIESDPARPHYIRTERGMGYLFTAPVQAVY